MPISGVRGAKGLTAMQKGEIIRYSVFFAILGLFIAYMVFGYYHARRRINKGLPPMGYHRACSLANVVLGKGTDSF